MHIDLRQLRHLAALAEHQSFLAAAEAVELSQSAFSRSIQALEHAAGYQLIDRSIKSVVFTKHGLLMLEHARIFLRDTDELANEIAHFKDPYSGRISFGGGPAPAAQLIPKAVASFITEHPRAKLKFKVDNWQELNKRLIADEIEFFVADTRHFEADADYRIKRLRPQRWHFCCRSDHPLREQLSISCAELFSYPLATTFRAPNISKILTEYSQRRDFTPTVECENSYVLLNIVRNSNSIGIVNATALDDPLFKHDLATLTVHDLPHHLEELSTRYGIVFRAYKELTPLAKSLINKIELTDEAISTTLNRISPEMVGV